MKRNKWTLKEQTVFLKMTGELLARGYPLSDALESIIHHLPQKRKEQIRNGISDLKEGYPFHLILQKNLFDKHLIGYVYFAEQHGGLSRAFIEGSRIMQRREQDITRLKKIFSYPIFLLFMTVILFFFVQKFLLPRFSTLFTSMNIKSNFFTNVIYGLNNILPFLLLFLSTFFICLLFYYLFKFKHISPIEQKMLIMKLPFISSFLRLFYTHFFVIQLSYLLDGGLSVNQALFMFERNEEQPFYQQVSCKIKEMLKSGDKFENTFIEFPFFERELSTIVKHGQENGKLAQELMFFANHCLILLEEKIDKLMKTIQPTIYALIGLLIVCMYLAVLLPMFHLLQGI